MKFKVNTNNETYITSVTSDEHIHEESNDQLGIDEATKQHITALESLRVRPKAMLIELRKLTDKMTHDYSAQQLLKTT